MSETVENTPEFPQGDERARESADAGTGEDLDEQGGRPELPPATFDFLVYSLRLQAEMNLGLLPFGEKQKPDFDLARHNIDLLAMLQQKTKGNLALDEQRALDNSVTELRFRFVQAKEKAPAE